MEFHWSTHTVFLYVTHSLSFKGYAILHLGRVPFLSPPVIEKGFLSADLRLVLTKRALMRHSRARIKSKLDRSEQLVYVLWDTLAHIFISHVLREGYKYFYIYTHTYKRVWVSKLTFQEKFSGYVRRVVHPPSARQTYFFPAQEDIIRGARVDIQKPEMVMAGWGDELTAGWRPLSALLNPSFPEKRTGGGGGGSSWAWGTEDKQRIGSEQQGKGRRMQKILKRFQRARN